MAHFYYNAECSVFFLQTEIIEATEYHCLKSKIIYYIKLEMILKRNKECYMNTQKFML